VRVPDAIRLLEHLFLIALGSLFPGRSKHVEVAMHADSVRRTESPGAGRGGECFIGVVDQAQDPISNCGSRVRDLFLLPDPHAFIRY
jgi:hypothetical protein